MMQVPKSQYLKFQTRWDKVIFYGSIIGSVIVLILTFARYSETGRLAKENKLLKQENLQLKEQLNLINQNR